MTVLKIQTLRVNCLGDFWLSIDGGPIVSPRPRVCELIALLLLEQGEAVARRDLARCLWPQADESVGLTNLRAHIKLLRGTYLYDQRWRIPQYPNEVYFDLKHVDVDAFEYRAALQHARQSGELADHEYALSLYSGSFLPFSHVRKIEHERSTLRELYLSGLESVAEARARLEMRDHAVDHLMRVLETDPVREKAVGFLLHLLRHDVEEAGSVYDSYYEACKRQNRLHSQAIEAQYAQIRDTFHRRQRREMHRENEEHALCYPRFEEFPAALQPLVDREAETEILKIRLSQSRLVTLIGAGGVGKTRLAVEACHAFAENYRDGVVYVDLAGLPRGVDKNRIAESIALTMDSRNHAGGPADRLAGSLALRHMLLVMDNCEHVAVAVAALTRMLLERCPRLTILATSRVELPAEYAAIVPLTPLALPPHDMVATAENVCRYSSAQLLEKAIANHRPEFRVTDENAAEVLRLCRLTGGLPLAIQIVGSVSGLTLAEIANQLEERGYVSLGESGSGCVARSDSVTGSVEWSLDLLSPGELKLFCRLGVFAGGWSREAAVKVAGEQNDDTPVTEACLNRLRACSLVEWGEAAGKSRYRMLEMLREVALRRLHESDLYYETSHRHLDYYVEKIEAIANVQNDAAREALLNSLGAEQDNLRVALDFAMESSMINKAVIISSGIARFCYMKGRHQEGHAWLDRVLAISAAAPPPVRLEALHGAATMAYMRNDYERAQQFWKECLELSRQVGNVPTELRTLGNLGSAAMAMDQFPAAKTYLEEALLGFERLQDIRGAARARAGLAGAASGMGDYATAQALYEHSITVFRAVADLVHLALHLCNLGDVLLKQDCITEAYGVLNEVIELNTRSENPRHLSHCLTIYVRLAARERDYARAAFLMGSEAALRDKIGFPLPMRAQVPYQQDVLNVVAHLGEEMFATLKNAGASTSLAEVRRFARIKR